MKTSYCLTVMSQDCKAEVLQSKAFAMFFSLPDKVNFVSDNFVPSSRIPSVYIFEVVFAISASFDYLVDHCVKSFERLKIDFCLQVLPIVEKRLFISDMDSTVLLGECLDDLGVHLGIGCKMSLITQSAMRGEIDFVEALHKRVAMLEGMSVLSMEKVRNNMIIRSGIAKLLSYLCERKIHTCLISGGFDFFTEYFANFLGFDSFFANRLEIRKGRLTGKLSGSIIDGRFKCNKLLSLASNQGLNMSQTIAMGDGANDIDMLRRCGLSIAIQGKPLLKPICCMQLNHCSPEIICDILDSDH